MKRTLIFAGLQQDLPALGNPGMTQAHNCVWTDGCYKQLLALSTSGDALSNRCQGAFAGRDTEGNTILYAGDSTKLYQRNGTAWSDKSNGTYSTQFSGFWKFRQFDSTVIATNYNDNPQKITIASSGNFSDLSSGAPKAKHVGIINQFVFLGNTADSVNGIVPHRVHWSAIGNPTDWPTLDTTEASEKQSDDENLNPTYGEIMGIADGEKTGLVFQENAVTRFTYVGGSQIFEVETFERSRGLIGPFAFAQIGDITIYLSSSGFCKTDGNTVTPIGIGTVDDVVLGNLGDEYNEDRIYAAVDLINKLVYFSYPTGSESNPTNFAIYNYVEDKWTTGVETVEFLFTSKSLGYTLEQLDDINSSIDGFTVSLDSSIWKGGNDLIMGFNTSHVLGDLSGSAKTATLDTQEGALNDGGKAIVQGVRPLVEGSSATVTVSILTRNLQSATKTAGTPASLNSRTGMANFRSTARYHSARLSISGGFDRAFGADFEFDAVGDV